MAREVRNDKFLWVMRGPIEHYTHSESLDT